MLKLIIEDDEGRTTVVPLVRDELTIGRKEGNTIRLTERNVSRQHARLFKQNGAFAVEDFGSYTGVRLNGQRVAGTVAVKDGDQVQIGDYKLSLREDAGADAVPPTRPGVSSGAAGGDAAAVAAVPAAAPAPAASPSASAPGGAGPAAPERLPTPTHLDAAPTIPLRTLEEQGRAPKLGASSARLVVVTSDLAGLDFKLDRPSLVVGRTEENDIILNHPSISRHHAKVVRDGDRYTVVDLQSANGVRVAGESYERVDVQPGDIVELGHVKLRFVGPWEDWTYDAREFAPKSRRKLKIGAAVGGVALAGMLVLALRGKPEPPPVVVAPPPVSAGPTPEQLLAEATKAVGEEDWDKAVSAIDMLLAHPGSDPAAVEAVRPQAVELKRKVDLERRGAETFTAFQQAAASKEPDVAMSRFDEIPTDSVYKERAAPALEEVRALFLEVHLDLADSARQQGRCDEARAEAEKIQQIDAENVKAREIVKRCRPRGPTPRVAASPATAVAPPAVAAAAPTDRTAPRPVAPRPARAAAAGPGARGAAETAAAPADEWQPDAGELIKQAREAWMHQQCGTAIDLSRRALKIKPSSNDAHQIIAVCACSSKDRDGAVKSYAKLDERSRAMVRTLCARNGVELD